MFESSYRAERVRLPIFCGWVKPECQQSTVCFAWLSDRHVNIETDNQASLRSSSGS